MMGSTREGNLPKPIVRFKSREELEMQEATRKDAGASATPDLDIVATLEKEDLGIAELTQVRKAAYSALEQRTQTEEVYKRLERGLVKFSAENKAIVRRGIVAWILGRNEEAVRILAEARLGRDGMYVLGRAYLDNGSAHQALPHLEKAAEGDTEHAEIHVSLSEARNRLGLHDDALTALQAAKKTFDKNANYQYAVGLTLDNLGRYAEAMEAYKKAMDLEPENPRALFRMAYNYDLRGDEDRAMEIYERLRKTRPPYANVLLNLGLMYEDRCQFEKAIDCYQTILDTYPLHERAQLYLSDARASLNMYYDEEARKKEHRVGQMLNTPISEFQLSVRSRNCLAKLGVNTLGDMAKKTEQELLTCKNFGETSLREVRELLRQRGLTLAKTEQVTGAPLKPKPLPVAGSGAKEDVLTKPLGEFEWSARARKCMERLGLQTINDLVTRSEADLLQIRNFGLTSLNEIRQKLSALGLSLKSGK